MGTGCSLDEIKNPRLHITKLNKLWKSDDKYNENNNIDKVPFLDAGIISYSKRSKANNGVLDFNNKYDMEKNGLGLVDFVDMKDQEKYKYIIYIEGNSAAYRLPYMLSLNSVVILVNSKI